MKLSKVIAAVVLAATVSTPAFAWGPREQGALAGVAGVLLYQHITQPRYIQPAPVYSYPAPVYQAPPVVYSEPYTYRPMYKAVDIFDSGCQCYRTVMVQVN